MSAKITGAHRKIIYEPGLNNAWVQLHKYWVGYVYALCGTPPGHVVMEMDEYGVLTLTPDFSHEGEEIETKRKEAIAEAIELNKNRNPRPGKAETWLREHKLWNTDMVKCKQGRGRPSTRRKVAAR